MELLIHSQTSMVKPPKYQTVYAIIYPYCD